MILSTVFGNGTGLASFFQLLSLFEESLPFFNDFLWFFFSEEDQYSNQKSHKDATVVFFSLFLIFFFHWYLAMEHGYGHIHRTQHGHRHADTANNLKKIT
jgi:hypothetical protein